MVAPITPKRILIVDDESVVCDVLQMTLSYDGHQTEIARNGEEALAWLETGTFDLVLTDLAMAGMNGEELARAVKQRDRSKPVILLTGVRPKVQSADIDLILTKPFDLESIRGGLAAVFAA